VARIVDRQARALDELSEVLDRVAVPASPTLVELESPRGTLQLLAREIARAEQAVRLVAPADAFPALTPALRKAAAGDVRLALGAPAGVTLPFAPVAAVTAPAWPGEVLLFTVDSRGAVIGSREGDAVSGHWGTSPVFVAAAGRLLDTLLGPPA
jgi:hypothetical protein